MLIEAGERLAVLRDRFVVAALARQLLCIALQACDVTADARFVLVASQVGIGVQHLLHVPAGALGRAAAEQIRNQLGRDIRNDARIGEQREHPDPDRVPAGLDAVDDQQNLDDERENEENHETLLTPGG